MKHPAVNEIINDPAAPYQAIRAALKGEIHCSLPGIVQSFDPATQTATIQPAIRNRVAMETGVENVQLPLLANVPVFFPGGGQFALTMPVQQGDECLVVFADSCIDAWWQSGDVQNQIDMRSHDISDGFAFVGFRSREKAIPSFSTETPTLVGGSLTGTPGPEGKSAYQVWLDSGNTGTIEDYLQSLKGQDGPIGPEGPEGPPGQDGSPDTAEQILSKLTDKQSVLLGNGSDNTHREWGVVRQDGSENPYTVKFFAASESARLQALMQDGSYAMILVSKTALQYVINGSYKNIFHTGDLPGLLAAILTFDGHGSGIVADMVDDIHASELVKRGYGYSVASWGPPIDITFTLDGIYIMFCTHATTQGARGIYQVIVGSNGVLNIGSLVNAANLTVTSPGTNQLRISTSGGSPSINMLRIN